MARVDDWALILDWDVALLSIDWYDRCLRTVERVGHGAGLVSCVTNRIGCPLQKASGCPSGDDLEEHRVFARKIATLNDGKLADVTDNERWKLSGMFLLTHRTAWESVGPVPDDKFIGLDNWYHDRVRECGLRVYVMHDVYVYHGYRRQWQGKPEQEARP